ncbi:DUF2283 domain-containing protein [Massilia violaceinigra]|uniref:DUF2283 domain-containing protein n=1 Tax=Massilia violaceinigra TaxID=2045208 RepID=A0ABY4AB72_9BURK|nr:DUF2283 domain-containing protein [Massilia violaceinigra]UOD32059.1 DUF2283 domain-containing protein [Massilia violaceinigra]
MPNGKFELTVCDSDPDEDPGYDPEVDLPVAYLSLPDHPGKGMRGTSMVRLSDLMEYEGADVFMDFVDGRLVGIEVLP